MSPRVGYISLKTYRGKYWGSRAGGDSLLHGSTLRLNSLPCHPVHKPTTAQQTICAYPSAKQQSLTPMARLNGARRPIPFTEASPRKPDAMATSPVPHVAMRKVSARKWDGYPLLWCSVTIQDSNAVTSRVELAPEKYTQVSRARWRRFRLAG